MILTLCSCETYVPPKTELCGITKHNDMACNDKRLETEDYTRYPKVGDLCTNSADFKAMRFYCIDLREKLIKCERASK